LVYWPQVGASDVTLRRLFLPVLFLAPGFALAQSEPVPPAFEVASVKPAEPLAPDRRFTPLGGGPGTKSPARLEGTASMKTLLLLAYRVKSYQVTGPAWMETARYEIAAKIPPRATKEQVALMVQNLLMERFHLAVHRATKELPIYALLVGKNGPKLTESDPAAAAEDEKAAAEGAFPRPRVTMGADGFPQIPTGAKFPGTFVLALASGEFTRTKLFARHETIDELAGRIGGYVNRPVQNLTELPGQYDFTLAFESDSRPEMRLAARPTGASSDGVPPAPAEMGPTIFVAVQEQLGLKLEQRRGPVEMLIVDRLEKLPTGN
jgi:uncharacterized protein (TIGR03435 family)